MAIVAQLLKVFTSFFVDLDGLDMDRLVADKSCCEPNSRKAPVSQELNEKREKINIFCLRWKWITLGPYDLDDAKKRERTKWIKMQFDSVVRIEEAGQNMAG